MRSEFIEEFIDQAIQTISENSNKLRSCLNELSEEQIWQRPNENSNSTGNLVLHLCGNIRQWIISSLGRQTDVRARDEEFAARGGHSRSQLLEKFLDTVGEARAIIESISAPELLRKREVQGFDHSGIAIIIHVTEHLSYHTGQIIFWTKLLKNKDLAFYSGVKLNAKNKD